ncbi:MAG TPA: thioester domain-containing protein [Anaerolineae bacterium]|nr:thioester domain-containing protein [Anaerolineae bacterium]
MMSTHNGSGRQAVQLAVVLALLMAFIAAPGLALGQEAKAMPAPFVAQIDANATVEIPVHGFCLDYGLPFPGASLAAGDLAPDQVRQAINYALGQGYVTTEPWQTQLAVWYFVEGAKVDEEYSAVADEIIAFVEANPASPEEGATAVPLHEAVDQGLVSVTLDDFENTSPPEFFFIGSGTLVITNLTDQPLEVLIPFGVSFAEVEDSGNQSMAIFVQPDVEPPMVPKTGAALAPELMALLGLAGVSGSALLLRRRAAS